MLTIDGSLGEGGGQMLRSALALATVTHTAFRMVKIRAKRTRPGLLQQHLTAVRAASAICGGEASGAQLGSQELTFQPGEVRGGDYAFNIGTAGSTTLVLQTILPALVLAPGPSTVTVDGGTHNPQSPPFDFLSKTFLPLLNRMGPRVQATLDKPGFYPSGGGRLRVSIEPAPELRPLDLLERGEIRSKRATATVAGLPEEIAQRQVDALSARLGWEPPSFRIECLASGRGRGNVVSLELESEHLVEVFTGFGVKGVPAERVADAAASEALAYLQAGVPVGQHLADQLLLPLALAGRGSFRTLEPSTHTQTQTDVLRQFLELQIRQQRLEDGSWRLDVTRTGRLGRPS